MYYLNAFNEMLRKRQRQNMMGGEGYQGGGNAPPSGPMGLGPAQDRSALRDFYDNMSPGARFGLGMIPGVGKALSIGNLANYAMSQYDKSQLAPADAAMAAARQGFQASEKSGYNAPAVDGYVDDSGDRLGFSGPTVGGPMSQPDITGTGLAPMAYEAISSPVSQPSVTGTALGGLSGGLQGGGSGSTGLYGDASAGMDGSGYGGGSGAPGANADGYGGGDAGFGGNSQAFNQGGMVTPDRLMGRAPAPDDGYGALQGGEYVITKAAVEKYGKRLLDAINNGTFR
jgi:hypothetical protein